MSEQKSFEGILKEYRGYTKEFFLKTFSTKDIEANFALRNSKMSLKKRSKHVQQIVEFNKKMFNKSMVIYHHIIRSNGALTFDTIYMCFKYNKKSKEIKYLRMTIDDLKKMKKGTKPVIDFKFIDYLEYKLSTVGNTFKYSLYENGTVEEDALPFYSHKRYKDMEVVYRTYYKVDYVSSIIRDLFVLKERNIRLNKEVFLIKTKSGLYKILDDTGKLLTFTEFMRNFLRKKISREEILGYKDLNSMEIDHREKVIFSNPPTGKIMEIIRTGIMMEII